MDSPSSATILPLADTSNIGIPDLSFTVNNVPSKSSSIANNVPSDPIILNKVEPEPISSNPPVEPDNIIWPVDNEADIIVPLTDSFPILSWSVPAVAPFPIAIPLKPETFESLPIAIPVSYTHLTLPTIYSV